jgi:hypothetical protein
VTSDSEQLVALLHTAWQGEWYGVRVYGEIAAARPAAHEAATMLELVVLETYVLGELTVALLALGIEPETDPVEAEADADVAAHVDDEWDALITWLGEDAESALAKYLPLQALTAGDPSLALLAQLVIDHERALISFAERTASGRADALDDVRSLVRIEH